MPFSNKIKSIDTNKAGIHEVTDDELTELKNILLEMIQDIRNVCKEYNIAWSLSGGSVIGAVRHKGFIPWDDDIDLFMTRHDYEKFKRLFSQTLGEKYILKQPGDSNYILHFPQIHKKNTTLKNIQSIDESDDGVFVDIFILEDTYDNFLLRYLHGIECTAYLFIDSVMRVDRCKDNLLRYSRGDLDLQRAINIRKSFSRFLKFWPLEKWLKKSDKCFSKANNPKSKMVVSPAGGKHYFGELWDRKKMCTLKEIPFEDKYFYIMADYDYYLSKRYGKGYMTLPHEDERERHLYIDFDLNGNKQDK